MKTLLSLRMLLVLMLASLVKTRLYKGNDSAKLKSFFRPASGDSE